MVGYSENKGDFGGSAGNYKLKETSAHVLRRLWRRPVVRRRHARRRRSRLQRPAQHPARHRCHARNRGDPSGWHFMASVLGGYWFRPAPTCSTARSCASPIRNPRDGFSEQGSDSTALSYGEQKRESLITSLGWQAPAAWACSVRSAACLGIRERRRRAQRHGDAGRPRPPATRFPAQAGRQLVRCRRRQRRLRRRDRLHHRQPARAARTTATITASRSACASRCSGRDRGSEEPPRAALLWSRYAVGDACAQRRRASASSPAIARGPYHDVHSPSISVDRLVPVARRAPRHRARGTRTARSTAGCGRRRATRGSSSAIRDSGARSRRQCVQPGARQRRD